jgi:hypothetical protein
MRQARDATLGMPKLLYPSLRAGQFPPEDEDGRTFLKSPIGGL